MPPRKMTTYRFLRHSFWFAFFVLAPHFFALGQRSVLSIEIAFPQFTLTNDDESKTLFGAFNSNNERVNAQSNFVQVQYAFPVQRNDKPLFFLGVGFSRYSGTQELKIREHAFESDLRSRYTWIDWKNQQDSYGISAALMKDFAVWNRESFGLFLSTKIDVNYLFFNDRKETEELTVFRWTEDLEQDVIYGFLTESNDVPRNIISRFGIGPSVRFRLKSANELWLTFMPNYWITDYVRYTRSPEKVSHTHDLSFSLRYMLLD